MESIDWHIQPNAAEILDNYGKLLHPQNIVGYLKKGVAPTIRGQQLVISDFTTIQPPKKSRFSYKPRPDLRASICAGSDLSLVSATHSIPVGTISFEVGLFQEMPYTGIILDITHMLNIHNLGLDDHEFSGKHSIKVPPLRIKILAYQNLELKKAYIERTDHRLGFIHTRQDYTQLFATDLFLASTKLPGFTYDITLRTK